jgi:hypothetical protein
MGHGKRDSRRARVHVHGTDRGGWGCGVGGADRERGRDASIMCVCARAFVCVHVFALDMLHACTPPGASAEIQGLYTGPMGLSPWLHAKPAILGSFCLFWPEMFFLSIRVLGKIGGFSIRAGPK